MHQYKELNLCQKSIDLVIHIDALTRDFPQIEKFGLVPQINRSAESIPLNIGEGAGRNSNNEFVYFLPIAHAFVFRVRNTVNYLKKFILHISRKTG